MTISDLVDQLGRMDPEAIVLLGSSPGPLAHLTPTVNGFVLLDKCLKAAGGTCCR